MVAVVVTAVTMAGADYNHQKAAAGAAKMVFVLTAEGGRMLYSTVCQKYSICASGPKYLYV
jgi:hypothetical protein